MPKTQHVDFKAVKAAVSMLQILDHYGLTDRFKRNGDALSGACPLHDGDNPTQFRVSLTKNCWNCFGRCKQGGNILDFVARKESLSIRDAALQIAEWFQLTFDVPVNRERSTEFKRNPERKSPPAGELPKEKAQDTEAGPNKPLGFELQNLDTAHPYLTERGLSAEIITEFGLGYCSKGSMAGRIVIPIHNADGKLVAYAGRWPGPAPDGTPKYKLPNGFGKGQELFNLHRAIQQPAQEPLVIVEGYFDCIKLWQHGVKRVVALMGSTLSPAQEELIRQHTTAHCQVLVMLDEDEAGRTGRTEIVQRLVRFAYVKAHVFAKEGAQPESLTAEDAAALVD